MVFNLSETNSIALQYLYELRQVDVQKDRSRFRRNLSRLGQIMSYEISKQLVYKQVTVQTPLATMEAKVVHQHPVLITVLRAGIPFMQGFLDAFDDADAGFIGAFRAEGAGAPEIVMNYKAVPAIADREVILVDPMLATGRSIVTSLEKLLESGRPKCIHIASVIAAPEGIALVENFASTIDVEVKLWTAAIDDRLNELYYIVPGLGDAGDLSFGNK
jgi:uracil phosphoribosyltransferase